VPQQQSDSVPKVKQGACHRPVTAHDAASPRVSPATVGRVDAV
jgi:hypothetical protein